MHGMPDYGVYTALKTIHALADMAELAARLGSIVTFDRRGSVVWLDDFEDNINKWGLGSNPAGSSYALSTDTARSGGKSGKLTTPAGVDSRVSIWRFFPIPVLGKVGFEISFTLDSKVDNIMLRVDVSWVTDGIDVQIEYYPVTNTLRLYKSDATWVNLSTSLDLYSSYLMFHTIKLVIDINTRKYVRLLIDSFSFDLSAYGLYVGTPTFASTLCAFFYLYSNHADGVTNYVDDAIITQNEP